MYHVLPNHSGLHGHMMPNLCWLIYMAKAHIEGADRALGFHIIESIPRNNSMDNKTITPIETHSKRKHGCQTCDSPCARCGTYERLEHERFFHVFQGKCFCDGCFEIINPTT